jgi:hypothetical protein
MVDFKKLAEDLYNNATPEERERIDAYNAREAHLNRTRRSISATFTTLRERHVDQGPGKKTKYELYPDQVVSKPIEMRIEEHTASNGTPYDVLQFIGAVTGHEAFALREDFIEGLTKPAETAEEDIFSICWGSAKYARCDVSKSAVADYLRDVRPELFNDTPALTL